MGIDSMAVAAGCVRLASGVSFLVAPAAANRLWGADDVDDSPTAAVLLRSMGYRDALIGAGLLRAGWRGSAHGWFLASAGADAADLLGQWAVYARLSDRARRIGVGGAVTGVALGLAGAARAARR